MSVDIEKLTKLLNLTQSDSDGEALAAMRKANSVLKASNKLWDSVIGYAPGGGELDRLRKSVKELIANIEVKDRIISRLNDEIWALQTKKPEVHPVKQKRDSDIETMLSAIENDLDDKGKSNDFIDSLREQFDTRGSLTENQINALRKFYNNI